MSEHNTTAVEWSQPTWGVWQSSTRVAGRDYPRFVVAVEHGAGGAVSLLDQQRNRRDWPGTVEKAFATAEARVRTEQATQTERNSSQ